MWACRRHIIGREEIGSVDRLRGAGLCVSSLLADGNFWSTQWPILVRAAAGGQWRLVLDVASTGATSGAIVAGDDASRRAALRASTV